MQLDCKIKLAFLSTSLLLAAYPTRGNNQEVSEQLSPGEFFAECVPPFATEFYRIPSHKEQIALYHSKPVIVTMANGKPISISTGGAMLVSRKIGNNIQILQTKEDFEQLTDEQRYNLGHIKEWTQALLIPLAELKKLITAAQ
jgi:hypothetical protein